LKRKSLETAHTEQLDKLQEEVKIYKQKSEETEATLDSKLIELHRLADDLKESKSELKASISKVLLLY